jgi:hypothetical protein
MKRILTGMISLYWAAAFALMATITVRYAGFPGEEPAIRFLGMLKPLTAGDWTAMGFAAGFALVSVIFIWSAATSALDRSDGWGESDEVARAAFASAAALFVVALLTAALYPADGAFSAISIQMAALAACYAAVDSESRSARLLAEKKANARREAISQMALAAAHQTLLPRLVIGQASPERGDS